MMFDQFKEAALSRLNQIAPLLKDQNSRELLEETYRFTYAKSDIPKFEFCLTDEQYEALEDRYKALPLPSRWMPPPYQSYYFEVSVSSSFAVGYAVSEIEPEDDCKSAFVVWGAVSDKGTTRTVLPFYIVEKENGDVGGTLGAWFLDSLGEEQYRRTMKSLENLMVDAALKVMLCRLALAHQSTTTSEVKVPERVQAKRIRKGRAPLPEYKIVHINIDRLRHETQTPQHPGTPISPHMRRGHVRRYRSGKVAHVRPARVKGFDGPMPSYIVTGGQQ